MGLEEPGSCLVRSQLNTTARLVDPYIGTKREHIKPQYQTLSTSF